MRYDTCNELCSSGEVCCDYHTTICKFFFLYFGARNVLSAYLRYDFQLVHEPPSPPPFFPLSTIDVLHHTTVSTLLSFYLLTYLFIYIYIYIDLYQK